MITKAAIFGFVSHMLRSSSPYYPTPPPPKKKKKKKKKNPFTIFNRKKKRFLGQKHTKTRRYKQL